MATATKPPKAGIRGTTKNREVLAEPKRKVILWSDTEKDAVVGHALPIFSQMVEEGKWHPLETKPWLRHLLLAAQKLALPAERHRPVDRAPQHQVDWFAERVRDAWHASKVAIDAARAQAEEAAKEEAAKEAKKADSLYESRQLDEGYQKPRKAKVIWTFEERNKLIEAGYFIRKGDPRRSDLSVLRKAQEDVLPEDRHRELQSVAKHNFTWFFEGIEAFREPQPPEPEPAPADVLHAATLPAGNAFPEHLAILAPMTSLNRVLLGAVHDMLQDIRISTSLMAKIAEESAENRKILKKMVLALDPKLLDDPGPVAAPMPQARQDVPPAPAPRPTPMPEPEPEPAPAPAPIPHHYKPKIAVVAPHMTQTKTIREALEAHCDVRIFATGKEARNQRFSNAHYVIFSSMVGNDVVRMAENQIGRDKVAKPSNNSAGTIIDLAMKFSHKHVAMMEEKDRLAQEAKDKLKAQYAGASNGQNGVH